MIGFDAPPLSSRTLEIIHRTGFCEFDNDRYELGTMESNRKSPAGGFIEMITFGLKFHDDCIDRGRQGK